MNSAYRLIFITLFSHFNFAGARMTVSLYAVELHASPATVGGMVALFGVLGVFAAVPLGKWLDVNGTRGAYLLATVALSVSTLLPVLWPGLVSAAILCLVTGSAWSVGYVSLMTVLGRAGTPVERASYFVGFSMMMSFSAFIAPMGTGFVIDHFGIRTAFMILAVTPLLPLSVVLVRAYCFPPPPVVDASVPRVSRGTLRSVVDLFSIAPLRRAYIVGVLAQGTWNVFTFVIPLFGISLGFSASQIGMVLGAFALASVVVRALANWILPRFTPWQIVTISMAQAAIAVCLIPFFTSFVMQVILAFALGLGLGLSSPTAMSLTNEASPPDRVGEANGVRLSMMSAMQLLAPLLAGAAGALIGIGSVFWMLGGLLGMGARMAHGQNAAPGKEA